MELKNKIENSIKDQKQFVMIYIITLLITCLLIVINYYVYSEFIYCLIIILIIPVNFMLSLWAISVSVPTLFYFTKLKKDEEYKKIISGTGKNIFTEHEYYNSTDDNILDIKKIVSEKDKKNCVEYEHYNLYFTDNCIMDIWDEKYIKINYEDVAIAYIENGYIGRSRLKTCAIAIINKKMKKTLILTSKYLSKKKAEMVIEEIKLRVPNVLIGNTPENINKVKENNK